MNIINDARAWLRERKEAAAQRKAMRLKHRSVHDTRFFMLSIPAAATILAAVVEWYWAILFCIQATGGFDWNYQGAVGSSEPPSGAWNIAFSSHLPVFIGLVCATIPIIMWSMVWLPVQFHARGSGRVRRTTMVVTGLLANVLVIVSGTVVMNSNRQTHVREGLVVEQRADAGRAALQAQIDGIDRQLAGMRDQSRVGVYAAIAANVGADAYRSGYLSPEALAATDPARRDLVRRALGAAQAADSLQAQEVRLRAQLAASAPRAATVAHVQDNVGVGLDTFAQYAEVYRPPFVALLCTLVGIFGVWWIVAIAERFNPLTTSGWADEAHRIEDHSDEPAMEPEGSPVLQTVVREENPETGEVKVLVVPKKKPKPYMRTLVKGRKTRVEDTPDPLPDERGADPALDGGDGGLRSAGSMLAGGENNDESGVSENNEQNSESHAEPVASPEIVHEEPPEVVELDEGALAQMSGNDGADSVADDESAEDESTVPSAEHVSDDALEHSIPPQEPQQVADFDEQSELADGDGDEQENEEVEHYDNHVRARNARMLTYEPAE